jgi:protein-disulfide isomerase
MTSSFSYKAFSLSLACCAFFVGQTAYAQAFPLEEGQHLPPLEKREAIRGTEGAAITMVEYADYECPFCKSLHYTMRKLMSDYQGKVNWVLRQYPLPFHPMAQPSAQAVMCILQKKGSRAFWRMSDGLFSASHSNPTAEVPLKESNVRRLAARNGLRKKEYDACQKDQSVIKLVYNEMSKGTTAGVQGTPTTFLINNRTGQIRKLSGAQPIEQFKEAIDALLKF